MTPGPRAAAAAAALALVVAGAAARAHVVYGTTTLSRLVAESDVVARARIREGQALLSLEGAGAGRPQVRAEVLEAWKGGSLVGLSGPGEHVVRFVQHGHGVAEYLDGEEAIVFLRRIERSRELDELAGSGVRFVSVQEHDEKLLVRGPGGDALANAVRAYARLERRPARERADGQRQLTLELLASPSERVALSALRDLLAAGDAFALSSVEAGALGEIVGDAASPLALRAGLLAELERRRQIDAPAQWARLVRETRGEDRLAAIAAAGAHPSDAVREALVALAAGDDPLAAEAALVALGWPRNDAAVPALAQALASDSAGARGAAVRGLAGVGTPSARAALERAAQESPDAATRRRAAAAARRLAPQP